MKFQPTEPFWKAYAKLPTPSFGTSVRTTFIAAHSAFLGTQMGS